MLIYCMGIIHVHLCVAHTTSLQRHAKETFLRHIENFTKKHMPRCTRKTQPAVHIDLSINYVTSIAQHLYYKTPYYTICKVPYNVAGLSMIGYVQGWLLKAFTHCTFTPDLPPSESLFPKIVTVNRIHLKCHSLMLWSLYFNYLIICTDISVPIQYKWNTRNLKLK